jgi:hypothetical protein
MRLLHEWRVAIVVGIVCLGAGVFLGRLTTSDSRPRDVSIDSETCATCMALYRDIAGCAEVMKRLASNRPDGN